MIWTRWPTKKDLVSTDCSIYLFVCLFILKSCHSWMYPRLILLYLIKWSVPPSPSRHQKNSHSLCATRSLEESKSYFPPVFFYSNSCRLEKESSTFNSFHIGHVLQGTWWSFLCCLMTGYVPNSFFHSGDEIFWFPLPTCIPWLPS